MNVMINTYLSPSFFSSSLTLSEENSSQSFSSNVRHRNHRISRSRSNVENNGETFRSTRSNCFIETSNIGGKRKRKASIIDSHHLSSSRSTRFHRLAMIQVFRYRLIYVVIHRSSIYSLTIVLIYFSMNFPRQTLIYL